MPNVPEIAPPETVGAEGLKRSLLYAAVRLSEFVSFSEWVRSPGNRVVPPLGAALPWRGTAFRRGDSARILPPNDT